MQCARCGHLNPSGQKFCGNCGQPLATFEPPRVAAQLEALARAELITEQSQAPDPEYVFRHALTQDTAYNSLLVKRRKEIHLRTALALEQLYPTRTDELAPTLAYHFRQGEDWGRAATYALRAGARAKQVYALREALAQFSDALDSLDYLSDASPTDIIDALLEWSSAAFKFRPRAEILEKLARAETLARGLEDKPRLARVLEATANAQLARGFPSRAYPALQEAYQLAQELGDEKLSVVPTFYLALFEMENDPRGALGQLEQALELARKYGNRDVEAYALGTEGIIRARMGEFARAREASEQALEITRTLDSPMTDSEINLYAGWTYLDSGDAARGLEYGQRGVDRALAADAMECVCYGFACVGFGNLGSGKVDAAQDAFRESIRRSEFSGAAHIEVLGRAGLGVSEFLSGRREALEEVEAALAQARALGLGYTAAFIAQTLGGLYAQAGAYARAGELLDEAENYYRKNELRPYLARTLEARAALYEKQGRDAEGRAARERVEGIMEELKGKQFA